MPKIRPDGARSTGRAMASASAVASAEIAATSAARPVMRHQGCDDEERTGQGPGTDVPHVRGGAGVANHEVECGKSCDLRQPENAEPGGDTLPVGGDENGHGERD